MARKVINRKALREEIEAAERAGGGEEAKKAKPKPKKKKTSSASRKSRAAAPEDARVKVYWGVFNQALKRVALFEYSQKKQAEKRAKDLSKDGKSPHFVQKVKEAIKS